MKTKEIDCWANPNKASHVLEVSNTKNISCHAKAKLIIDLPEPTIEVTPSMIKDAFEGYGRDTPGSISSYVRKNLFGIDDYG